MAISLVEYALISKLRESAVFPAKPSLLELGRANWYGDMDLDQLFADLRRCVGDPAKATKLDERLRAAAEDPNGWFEVASVFWQVFLDAAVHEAIDLHGKAGDHRFDLNAPVPLTRQFDVVTNIGTAEHVFNVYQVFKTIHERTAPGGLMIHSAPFQGWVDHGFYNIQPTLFFDLAAANDYQVVTMAYGELQPPRMVPLPDRDAIAALVQSGQLGANATTYAVLRKPGQERPFAVPMQGYYAGKLTETQSKAWKTLR